LSRGVSSRFSSSSSSSESFSAAPNFSDYVTPSACSNWRIQNAIYLFFQEFQISSALILDILGVLTFIIPGGFTVPFFDLLFFILVIIILVIENEVALFGGFLTICLDSVTFSCIENNM